MEANKTDGILILMEFIAHWIDSLMFIHCIKTKFNDNNCSLTGSKDQGYLWSSEVTVIISQLMIVLHFMSCGYSLMCESNIVL